MIGFVVTGVTTNFIVTVIVSTKLPEHLSSASCLQILAQQSSAKKVYKYLIDKNIPSDFLLGLNEKFFKIINL